MGELFKTQHTIDEMLDRMGVKIVLDTDHLSEDDVLEAAPNCKEAAYTTNCNES